MEFDMESGKVLQDKVNLYLYCEDTKRTEGEFWQRLNQVFFARHEIDLIKEKNKFERENNLGDIPLAQWIAKCTLVHKVMPILDEMINGII